MKTIEIKTLLIRDLEKLRSELHLYQNPDDMWKLSEGIANSAGNLALHLVGNLRHFIGNELGKSGYVRHREEEFSQKNVSLSDLDHLITICITEISLALDQVEPNTLAAEFPKEIGGKKQSTLFALLHLLGHLSYHLGQINYHRRMINN